MMNSVQEENLMTTDEMQEPSCSFAVKVEEKYRPSNTPSWILEHSVNVEYSIPPKKIKVSDSPETIKSTDFDDCMIIGVTQNQVLANKCKKQNNFPRIEVVDLIDDTPPTSRTIKVNESPEDDCIIIEDTPDLCQTLRNVPQVEIIDLSDDSPPISSVPYCHVTTSYLQSIKPEPTLSVSDDVPMNVGASGSNAIVGGEYLNYRSMHTPVYNTFHVKNENCEVSDSFMPVQGPSDDFCNDSELYESGIFQTPLIKFMKCGEKIDVLELSNCIDHLDNLIQQVEKVFELEAVPDFTDSEDEFELCPTQEKKEIFDLPVNEKQSSNSKVDRILSEAQWLELKAFLNHQTNTTELNLNSTSSLLVNPTNEQQTQSLFTTEGLVVKMGRSNSPAYSPAEISEANWSGYSDSHTVYFNSPMDIDSPLEENGSSPIRPSSSDDDKPKETTTEENKNQNEELFPNDFLKQILEIIKPTETSEDIATICSSTDQPDEPVVKSNISNNESVLQNHRQIEVPTNLPIDGRDSISYVSDKIPERSIKDSEDSLKSAPETNENILKRAPNVLSSPSSTNGDTFETSSKKVKISEDFTVSKNGCVKKLSFEDYKKRDIHKTCPLQNVPETRKMSIFPNTSQASSLQNISEGTKSPTLPLVNQTCPSYSAFEPTKSSSIPIVKQSSTSQNVSKATKSSTLPLLNQTCL